MGIISGIITIIVGGVIGLMIITSSVSQFESGKISSNSKDMKVEEKVELGTIKNIDGHRITLDNGNNILLRKPGGIENFFSPQDISLIEGDTVNFQKFGIRKAYYLCDQSECHVMRNYSTGIEEKIGVIPDLNY